MRVVSFKIDEAEYEYYREAARRAGISFGQLVREALRHYTRERDRCRPLQTRRIRIYC